MHRINPSRIRPHVLRVSSICVCGKPFVFNVCSFVRLFSLHHKQRHIVGLFIILQGSCNSGMDFRSRSVSELLNDFCQPFCSEKSDTLRPGLNNAVGVKHDAVTAA